MVRPTQHITPLPFIELTRSGDRPLYLQLIQQLRNMILNGDIRAGQKLPSTRIIMKSHNISRSTVVTAFEQLISEGYLIAEVGAGTYVNPHISTPQKSTPTQAPKAPSRLSKRGMATVSGVSISYLGPRKTEPFIANVPAIDLFPHKIWSRIENQIRNRADQSLMTYGDPRGFAPLRVAISEYVLNFRGIKCHPDQVIITSGTQRSLNLISQVLLNSGDEIFIEDPSSPIVQQAFRSQGQILNPVRVGRNGAELNAEQKNNRAVRLAYLSPSCQYPLGVAMPIGQRLDWIDWATRNQSWIIEDDLDSEFTFQGRADPAIYSHANNGRALYVFSFNNMLFPSLRLGFIIAPEALAEPLQIANCVSDRSPNTWLQAVLAEFIQKGHLNTHIRRMQGAYVRRRSAIMKGLSELPNHLMSIRDCKHGLRVLADLPPETSDTDVEAALVAYGITGFALSFYCLQRQDINGIILGYGCTHEDDIPGAVEAYGNCLKEMSV